MGTIGGVHCVQNRERSRTGDIEVLRSLAGCQWVWIRAAAEAIGLISTGDEVRCACGCGMN